MLIVTYLILRSISLSFSYFFSFTFVKIKIKINSHEEGAPDFSYWSVFPINPHIDEVVEYKKK